MIIMIIKIGSREEEEIEEKRIRRRRGKFNDE
jgi:hypothetical protein